MDFLIKLLAIVGIVGIPLAFVIWIMRSRVNDIRDPAIEAEYVRAGYKVSTLPMHGGLVASGRFGGEPGGTRFILTATPAAKGTPAMTAISVPTSYAGSFAISREGSRNLSGHDLLESVLSDAKARDTVRALFALGFDTVAVRDETLRAIRTFDAALLDSGSLQGVIERLTALQAALGMPAETVSADWNPRADDSIPGSVLIFLISPLLLIAGIFPFKAGITLTQPFADAATVMMVVGPIIAVAYLALGACAVFFLRGRQLARAEICAILFAALPGLALGSWGAAMLVNQQLDQGASRELHAQVESRDYSWVMGSHTVIFAPWRGGGSRVGYSVSAEVHRNLEPGQRWVLHTRPGRLGFEWVESARPARGR